MPPLQRNLTTGEPFLRLDPPHHNIIITPPRFEDAYPSTLVLNDGSVYPWMGFGGPENPYTVERANKWIMRIKEASDKILEGEHNQNSTSTPRLYDGCPVRHIRRLNDDGAEEFLGDIGIERATWTEITDATERAELISANEKLEKGNTNIMWQLGYYLSPKYHGLGIISSAIETIIQKWAVPYMAAQNIRATAFYENEGSVRVLKKNGFYLVKTVHDCVTIGTESRSLNVLEWHNFP